VYAGRNEGRAVPPNLPPLTEVHVPWPEARVFPWEKLIWRGFQHISRNMFDMTLRPSTTVTGAVIELL